VGKGGKPVKQPFFIHPVGGGHLAMAGLYEIWRDRSKPEDDPEAFVWSSTVITTTAEDELGHIHDRMPLLVEPERWARWLDPEVSDADELLGLLVPRRPGRLEAYPVSTRSTTWPTTAPSWCSRCRWRTRRSDGDRPARHRDAARQGTTGAAPLEASVGHAGAHARSRRRQRTLRTCSCLLAALPPEGVSVALIEQPCALPAGASPGRRRP
jgi:hypothetical protein